MTSVLRYWVMDLPLREQGTLLAAMRGCDLAPKPVDGYNTERELVAYLRWLCLNPADAREIGYEGGYMRSSPPHEGWRQSELGHYPLHWVSHLMHAYEVVAYRHSDVALSIRAFFVYNRLARGLHLHIEPKAEFIERLSEDRIANGTVVS